MAEEEVVNQSDDSRRTGKRKMASGMRLDVGRLMVAVRSPGGDRSVAGDELLRRMPAVNVGRPKEDGKKTTRRSRRSGMLPGTRW
jgi:hypothetical protein